MALIITFPILATILIYFITYKVTGHKIKAIHNAVNWTTLLYIFATTFLSYTIFGPYLISIILSLLLLVLITIIIIQWKIKTEVVFVRALKVSWRIYFLLFLSLYIILSLIGVLQRIIYY